MLAIFAIMALFGGTRTLRTAGRPMIALLFTLVVIFIRSCNSVYRVAGIVNFLRLSSRLAPLFRKKSQKQKSKSITVHSET